MILTRNKLKIISLFGMISKGLLVILFVSFALSYEENSNILVLKEGDFPQVINEHKYIFINFYA